MARPISLLVLHCSASPNGRRTTVYDIDQWHRERGFQRDTLWREKQNPQLLAIGYHYVIYTSGTVVTGRHVDEIGAHAQRYNKQSIGICMIGTDRFTPAQWDSLRHLVTAEIARITHRPGPADQRGGLTPEKAIAVAATAGIGIQGHRDLAGVHKDCPGFAVSDWLVAGMQPAPRNLLEET